jgi:homoserine dehydrogenase
MTRSLSIGLLGLGNVGSALVRLLEERGAEIERLHGVRLSVVRAAVRDVGRSRGLGLAAGVVVADARAVVRDPAVQVVVELVGGVDPSGTLVADALELGKPVVTANKLLLAERGEALFALAAQKGVALRFEGAVCGGMPIVRLLREALASDSVVSLHGILNGTTNYILTRMTEEAGSAGRRAEAEGRSIRSTEGLALAPALKEAQAKGYAEADPSLDLGGGDAAQKLCLLARLAFGARVRPADILTEGIERLTPADLAAARELNSVVKLLAVARLTRGRLDLRVHPAMIPRQSPLAAVSGPFNAVEIQSDSLGSTLLSGQGAGGTCTATAVVADLIDVGRPGGGALDFVPGRDIPAVPRAEIESSYYLRFTVDDAPGVLAAITASLGRRGISIAALHQRDRQQEGKDPVAVVILTHRAQEGGVQQAVAEIDAFPTTRGRTQLIRFEG